MVIGIVVKQCIVDTRHVCTSTYARQFVFICDLINLFAENKFKIILVEYGCRAGHGQINSAVHK